VFGSYFYPVGSNYYIPYFWNKEFNSDLQLSTSFKV